MAAFLLLGAAWATAASPPQHALPAGTTIVFVTDAPLDAGRREGDVVSVHLQNDIVLDGTTIAPVGTRAYLVVGGTAGPGGKRTPVITLERFSIPAGLLPVTATTPLVAPIPSGAEIRAKTLAEVDHIGDRWSIRVPFPFALSGDQPASAYTPTPARTAPARVLIKPPPPHSPTTPPLIATPTPAPTPDPNATKIPSR
ncbi:MAG: hypothetical protein JO103_01650 [Candidatus Eremiobacteraeota bacterium]|nr:hypothetical protein [Candidatus Eremiobacteraeota bacterium]